MTKEWSYISGDNWTICDVCGEKHRASEMRLRWDNLWVDARCWETRHPQDFVQARNDKIVADIQRPSPSEVFIDTGELLMETGENILLEDTYLLLLES